MSSARMMTGNMAAAWGARLSGAEYVPAYPITPQTEIIEALSRWFADGTMRGKFVTMDSEHSMVTAGGAAAAAGARVFTATSSQGLLYAMEVLFTVSGWRVPFVLVNVSRGLASPITLESDHNDVLAARDSGFLQIHCETCQEIVDSILMAYRIGEDARVLLPVIVNMDGFTLSFTREPVILPDAEAVKEYLPPYRPKHAFIRASHPMAQGIAVLGGFIYSYFRYQQHLAARNALAVHEEAAVDFERLFGRRYGFVEEYRMEDAELVIVMSNAMATRGKAAVNRLREKGMRIGLLRLRVTRPWPGAAISAVLAGRKAVAVLDQNIAPGAGGIFVTEIRSSLYGRKDAPPVLSYIGGLGGKEISTAEFDQAADDLQRVAAGGDVPPPRLLYTGPEAERMHSLLHIAGKE